MPIQSCRDAGRPGFKRGGSGKCFTHDGTDAGRRAARGKAFEQGIAIEGPEGARREQEGSKSMEPDQARDLLAATFQVETSGDVQVLAAKFHDIPDQPASALAFGVTSFEQLDALGDALEELAQARIVLIDAAAIVENIVRDGGSASEIRPIITEALSRVRTAVNEDTGSKSLWRRLPFWRNRGDDLAAVETAPADKPPILFSKDGGRDRWAMLVSNNARDREGEILARKGHELNVAAIRQSGIYPEAWVGHAQGTRWGVADYVDYVDDVFVMSGLVDENETAQAIASKVAENAADLGVSHSYAKILVDGDTLERFFTYEGSVLPRENAASPLTGIAFDSKGTDMATPQQQQYILSVLGEDLGGNVIQGIGAVNDLVEEAGLDRKDDDGAADEAEASTETSEEAPASDEDPVTALKALVTPMIDEALETRLEPIVATMREMATGMKSVGVIAEALQKSDSERLTDLIRTATPHVASKDGPEPTEPVDPAANDLSEEEAVTVAQHWLGAMTGGKGLDGEAEEPVTN